MRHLISSGHASSVAALALIAALSTAHAEQPRSTADADVVVLRVRPHRGAAAVASARADLAAVQALAEATPGDDGSYVQVIDQDLRGVIAEYARQQGLATQIGSEVRQRIVNTRIPLARREFLATLQRRFGVSAYIDGGTLVAAGKTEVVTRLVPLGDVKLADVRRELRTAGIPLDEGSLKYLPESASVIVTAPAPIVARIAGIVEAVRAKSDHDAVHVLRFGQEGR